MTQVISTSETLIGSLCREVDYLRNRYSNLVQSIINSKDNCLINRLNKEKKKLERRQAEILEIAIKLKNFKIFDETSTDFLVEISSRPILIQ